MSYQLELRHFRYFMALSEELNYRKASEKLFISQPGLSRQIKQMEEVLDATLFIRTKRKVELTASGLFLRSELATIFNQLRSVQNQVALIDKGDIGEVRIGFLGSAMQKVLPEFLMNLNKNFPGIHTSLDEMNNSNQIDAIVHDRLDVGFVRIAHVPEEITIKPVLDDHFALALPANHAISQDNFKSIEQLRHESFILFSSDYSPLYYDKIISIFDDHGFSPRISHKSIHALTIFKLVEMGLGIAIVPSSLKHGFNLEVKFIELNRIPQKTTLSIIWKSENHNPALQSALRVFFDSKNNA